MTKFPQYWLYYFGGLGFIAIGTFLIWSLSPLPFLIGILLFGSGYKLCLLGNRAEGKDTTTYQPDQIPNNENSRTINVGGGTYNERHYGDYVTVQDNRIQIEQDFSQLNNRIETILGILKEKGYSQGAAEQQIIDELKPQVHNNPKVKQNLLRWRRFIRTSKRDSNEGVECLIRISESATETSSHKAYSSSQTAIGNYSQLEKFLEAENWEAADKETVRAILRLMPGREYSYTNIDVDEIPTNDLRKIDQLWIKYSTGKFGFSVQQRIWKKILKVYQDETGWVEDEAYTTFIDCVGWARESDRIYYVNLHYSLDAPKGHLPAVLHFEDLGYPSNYCNFDQYSFNQLMEREYVSSFSIPSWLKQWVYQE